MSTREYLSYPSARLAPKYSSSRIVSRGNVLSWNFRNRVRIPHEKKFLVVILWSERKSGLIPCFPTVIAHHWIFDGNRVSLEKINSQCAILFASTERNSTLNRFSDSLSSSSSCEFEWDETKERNASLKIGTPFSDTHLRHTVLFVIKDSKRLGTEQLISPARV